MNEYLLLLDRRHETRTVAINIPSVCQSRGFAPLRCANTAERIDVLLRLETPVDARHSVFRGVAMNLGEDEKLWFQHLRSYIKLLKFRSRVLSQKRIQLTELRDAGCRITDGDASLRRSVLPIGGATFDAAFAKLL